jgi:carboxyl-terminal processing protease
MSNSSKIIIGMVLIIAIALAFGGGVYFSKSVGLKSNTGLDVVKEAWDYIATDYVEPDKVNSENFTRAAIEGIITSLHDPYTSYLAPEELKLVTTMMQGKEEFEGIGAVVGVREEKLVIITTFNGAPAELAGIKRGDVIMAINGESVEGLSLEVATSKIRGPSGTTVTLQVLHQGENNPVEINIVRARVEVPSVVFEMRGDIAHIMITQFTDRTETEFAAVLQNLASKNAKGIILDLRSNSGGLLSIVVEVASHFISEGVIVSVRSNQGEIERYDAMHEDPVIYLPTLVLVDQYSASGAEVLTGALQDYDRAVIAGNVTFGKGSVNILQPLSDGSGILITIARWLTPKGRLIEGQGIDPDIMLEITGEEELQWAIDYLHSHNP